MAFNEEIRELDGLDIHKLSHAAYQELVDQNLVDENAIYLITDDEGFDTELNATSENAPQTKVVYEALQNLYGSNDIIPIENGGTGAANAETARANLGAAPAYTYGTTDLTAGTSTLAAGTLYFVYEE